MSEDPLGGESHAAARTAPSAPRHLVRAPARRDRARSPSPSTTATASRSRGSAGSGETSSPRTCGPGRASEHGGQAPRRRPVPLPVPPAALADVPVLGAVWAFVGAARIAEAQRQWWWVSERRSCGPRPSWTATRPEWRALHGIARKTRSWRGAVIGAEAFAHRPRAGAHRRVRALVVVAHRRRGGHAAARAQGQARAPADRPVGGDDAAHPEDQHRRDHPRLRARPGCARPTRRSRPTTSGSAPRCPATRSTRAARSPS